MKLMREKNESKKIPARALVLFSGGLDSILAVKILEGQGIEVTALTFTSYFFDAQQAEKSARENKIKLKIVYFSDAHFDIIKKPKYGRGAGMNPCIDCHLLMLVQAKKIAKKENFDIIATGEVLGQRPMSQNFRALELIERKAGLVGKILRPLCAKALPETEMERKQKSPRAKLLVDRTKLYGISGRSRKNQIELAKKYKIKYFPSPAGGCILTEKEYSKKLAELIEKKKKIVSSDLQLLRVGRHFWIEKTRIILGRNHEENLALKKIAEKNDVLIEPEDVPGPTALIRGKKNKAVLDYTKKLLLKYTKNAPDDLQVKIISRK
ncbi:MAG TPA: hypothetical protein VMQ48_02350 [Candidatus Saccharimonadales bacterium]|nr:hypothetical protein [Candidatus Saccharimonadales bacterium]